MIAAFMCILVVIIENTAANSYGNQDAQDAFERFRTYLEQSSLNNVGGYLEKMLNEWKNYSIHIGITGQSGVGKSTFINAIQGLRAEDPDAADVGVVETTKSIVSYRDKNNTNLVYWDLPGYGTLNFQDRQKPFALVRNKINAALENERQDHPSRSEQEVMEAIRNDLISQLGNSFVPIYLISTRLNQYHAWDFPKLIKDLIGKAPKAKQQAMIFSLVSTYKLVVGQKVQELRQRVWMIATLSAAVNFVPILGLSMAADISLLAYEVKFYRKTLALDVQSLLSMVSVHDTTLDELRKYYETLDNKVYNEIIFGREIVSFIMKKLSTSIVGQVVSSTTSFSVTFMILNDVLHDLHIAALKLLYFIELKSNSR
jgi:predicted GTPase